MSLNLESGSGSTISGNLELALPTIGATSNTEVKKGRWLWLVMAIFVIGIISVIVCVGWILWPTTDVAKPEAQFSAATLPSAPTTFPASVLPTVTTTAPTLVVIPPPTPTTAPAPINNTNTDSNSNSVKIDAKVQAEVDQPTDFPGWIKIENH